MKIEKIKHKYTTYNLSEINNGSCFILLENKDEILLKLNQNQIRSGECLCYNFNKNKFESIDEDYVCYKIENIKLVYEF